MMDDQEQILNRKREVLKEQITRISNFLENKKAKYELAEDILLDTKLRAHLDDLRMQYHVILRDEELSSTESVLDEIKGSLDNLQVRILKLKSAPLSRTSSNNDVKIKIPDIPLSK